MAANGLLDALKEGVSVERQPRLIAALGRLKAKSAAPVLVGLLASEAPSVRASSAEALGKIGELKTVDQPLRALLDDKVLDVRKRAIGALGSLKDRGAVAALIKAAQANETRFEASMALAELPDVAALHVYLHTARRTRTRNYGRRRPRPSPRFATRPLPVLDQLAARRRAASVRSWSELQKGLRRTPAGQVVAGSRPVPDERGISTFRPTEPST